MRPFILLTALLFLGAGCVSSHTSTDSARAARANAIAGTRATYCAAPRLANGRVDVDRLMAELIDLHANTYSFCIHRHETDWDDFQLIAARAKEKGIRVWGSVVPPSESPPHIVGYAEPFRLDYVKWAEAFARLSLRYTNVVAWSIDDFTHNLKTYNPEYFGKMMTSAHRINPKLAFVPCCYFSSINQTFVDQYKNLLDGFLFPYRHESAGSNLKDPSLIGTEIEKIKALTGPSFPVVLDIYATAHSKLGATTPAYVDEAIAAGFRSADGVMIYCHQDPVKNREKYQIIKKQFGLVAK